MTIPRNMYELENEHRNRNYIKGNFFQDFRDRQTSLTDYGIEEDTYLDIGRTLRK